MLLQGGVVEESHEIDEDNLTSLSWQEIAENSDYVDIFASVIEEFRQVEPKNKDDKLPDQLLDVAHTILHISLNVKSVKSHRENFARLFGQATSLVVVFWHLYKNLGFLGSMWPPFYLREVIDKLECTVYFINKLMIRKSKSLTKRAIVGCFGLRDLRKFKRYQRKLASVAKSFESEPNNVIINEVLVEIISKSRAQHDSTEDEDTQPSAVRNKKRSTDKEHSRLPKGKAKQIVVEVSSDDEHMEKNKPAAKKTTTRRQMEAQSKPKGTRSTNSDKKKESSAKRTRYQESDDDVVEVKGTFKQGSRTNKAPQSKTKKRVVSPAHDDEEYDKEFDESLDSDEQFDRRAYFSNSKKQKTKPTPLSPQYSISDLEEATYRQRSRTSTGNTTQSKTRKRSESSMYYDDDEKYSDTEIPDVEPVPLGPKKKKKPTSKQKKKSTPVSPMIPQYSPIPGFYINNGSGFMTNQGMGNITNTTIEDSFNDNSVNGFPNPRHGRRRPSA